MTATVTSIIVKDASDITEINAALTTLAVTSSEIVVTKQGNSVIYSKIVIT